MFKIGIVGHLEPGKTSTKFGLNAAYVSYFSQYGQVIVIDPRCSELYDIDMLVLPGGADVNPVRYGQAPSVFTGRPDTFYEYFDTVLLPQYVELAKKEELAIWGTCRGAQTLVAHFGGTLEQHIKQALSDPRSKLVDKVKLIQENQPQELLESIDNAFTKKRQNWYTGKVKNLHNNVFVTGKYMEVNSIHHQGFYDHNFKNTDLVPLGKNVIYKNIEAFIHKTLPVIGVQYHPEEIFDEYANILMSYLKSRVEDVKEKNNLKIKSVENV